jgi:hypothetical protein
MILLLVLLCMFLFDLFYAVVIEFTHNNTSVTVPPFIFSLSFLTTCFGLNRPSSGVFTLLIELISLRSGFYSSLCDVVSS